MTADELIAALQGLSPEQRALQVVLVQRGSIWDIPATSIEVTKLYQPGVDDSDALVVSIDGEDFC